MCNFLNSEVKKQIKARCNDLEYFAWKVLPYNLSAESIGVLTLAAVPSSLAACRFR